MKHAAKQRKSAVKPKAKTLTQIKTVGGKNPPAKKSVVKINSNSRPLKSAKNLKAAAKAASKNGVKSVNRASKKTAPKLSAKTLDALKTISARRAEPAAKQSAKKTAAMISTKTGKAAKPAKKEISSVKKAAPIEKKTKKIAASPKTKLQKTTAKSKVSAKSKIKTSAKADKPTTSKIVRQTVKPRRLKTKIAAVPVKTKLVRQKSKPIVETAKSKKAAMTNPVVKRKTVKSKKAAAVSAKRTVGKLKKIQPIVAAKKSVKKANQIKTTAVPKKVRKKVRQSKPVAAIAKWAEKTKKTGATRKNPVVEKPIEAQNTPAPKPKNRKARPISSAVFRGKKERYDFKVFALNEKFEPIPAVYIISKRKIDRRKKGHHALVCIGQTDSIFDEIKRHRKGKCVKKHEANAVSILQEADEKTRLQIEIDLKAAHAVACTLG